MDSLRKKSESKSIFSFGSAGILIQVASLYVFSAILKSGREWIPDGTAVYFALSVDQFATHIGKWFLAQSSLLPWLTYATYYFELLGPFLLFFPFAFGFFRTVFTFGFIILQAGFGLSLRLGPFPWIASAAMIVFIPAWFWDRTIFGRKIEKFIDKLWGRINYGKNYRLYRWRLSRKSR